MKNSEYWEKRIAKNTWNIYNSLEQKNKALLEMYQEASTSISDELYKLAEKMKTATPMLSDMHRFNRLTKLQENINSIIKELGNDLENFGKKNMYEGFSKNYKAIMEALEQIDFAIPNKKLMEQLLNKPWLGSNFSERLWKNTKVLAINLNDILITGLVQGKTVTEMAIQLNNRMNQGFNAAHRLVRTETMHYLNESSFMAYKDAGCEKVQYWAAEDERTCPRCGMKHGNTYSLKDRPILPLHANCRCTYLPVIDEVDAKRIYDEAKENINNENNVEEFKNDGIINNKKWLKAQFPNENKFKKHVEKHSNEYNNISAEKYLNIARKLLAADLNKDIDGFKSKEGFIFKYNKETNDFAIGRADGKISTLFKPDEKLDYWEAQKELYGEEE
ncbi:minor capsid protein [Clostridium baratii]|uniref:minor capsid protein n=1 Tax=Clostridium baratii TaxID=1561 RepID=UPI002909905E|nr:minor capsid protein [Clostridium baratii]MDU4910565.1 minor capsid protein [Clostridium baratii]